MNGDDFIDKTNYDETGEPTFEYNPTVREIDPVMQLTWTELDQALTDSNWMGALVNLRNLINIVHGNIGEVGFSVIKDSIGYHVVTLDQKFGLPFRWACDALTYAQEMVEMGYEPTKADIFDVLMAEARTQETAYNEWLEDQADKWDSYTS